MSNWYQNAVFYEILVRGFYDANGDGTGDLAGVTSKLDYLEWLGVDCLWLLPFYQSPLLDRRHAGTEEPHLEGARPVGAHGRTVTAEELVRVAVPSA